MYELRAEYGPEEGRDDRSVSLWHYAEAGADRSLCDRPLVADAERRPLTDWESVAHTGCWTCFSLYIRTLPPPD
jgi:hypothetical protein